MVGSGGGRQKVVGGGSFGERRVGYIVPSLNPLCTPTVPSLYSHCTPLYPHSISFIERRRRKKEEERGGGGQRRRRAAECSGGGFAAVEGRQWRRRRRRGSDVESDVITYRNSVRRGRDVFLEQK